MRLLSTEGGVEHLGQRTGEVEITTSVWVLRHSCGDVVAVGYTSLEFREDVQAREKHLGVPAHQ